MAKRASSKALKAIGCFVNTDWEVRHFSDPYDRIVWDNQLQYDQLVRNLCIYTRLGL